MKSFNEQCDLETPEVNCKHFTRCSKNFQKIGKILLTTHHLYWPRTEYQTKLERKFRELPENKTRLCPQAHEELHATESEPEKPEHADMVQAVMENALEPAVLSYATDESLKIIHERSGDE